jgi:hypothetical protein
VEFTLAHALENGWEEFTVNEKKYKKTVGEDGKEKKELISEEEIIMPASVENEDGAHVYEGTIGLAKYPKGRQIILKEAMSLSKQRWSPKEKSGSHPELYEEFEAQYVEEDADDAATETTEKTTPSVRRLTAAEKEAEKEAAKKAKEEEKAAKKAEKEAEKAAKKAEKEAEKAAKTALKPGAVKKTATSATAPIAPSAVKALLAEKKTAAATAALVAPKKRADPMEEPEEEEAPAAPVPVAPKKTLLKKPAAKEEWTCPDDGQAHPWSVGGKKYMRVFSGEVYEANEDGTIGSWVGMFDKKTNKIDTSVPEPEYDEE